MRNGLALLGGIGVGAGAVFWLDPAQGRRRRALTAQKLTHGAHALVEGTTKGARDLAHRTRGAVATGRSRLRRGVVPDEILEERVRAKLGRVCSHPGALTVRSRGDHVELTGPILRKDVKRVLSAVHRIHGVEEVRDRMEVHERPDNISGLQGPDHRVARFSPFRESWTPATRLVAGVTGAGLLTFGVTAEGLLAWPCRVIGAGVILRSVINRSVRSLIAISGARMAVDALETASERTEAAIRSEMSPQTGR